MYKQIPQEYTKLAEQSSWNFDFSHENVDPYYLRTPLCRIKGNWDPTALEIHKEKLTSSDVTTNQQNFSGLSLQDRYVEGYSDDCDEWVNEIVNVLPFARSRSLVHIQKPGQMHMLHMDANYGNGFWDYLGEEKSTKLARVMIMLDDWAPGQIMMFGGFHCTRWSKGDVIYFRWQDLPHGTANFGHTVRPLILTTGEITDEFEYLFNNFTTFTCS